MSAIGLGAFQSSPEETAAAVEAALKTGCRHIDTAAAYLNERQVGEGIHRSGVERAEVFIETKVWVSDYGYGKTLHAFEKASRKLGIDQLDLLILHQPAPDRFDRTVEAYKALEKLLADGNVRAIGVSNFMRRHLTDLIARTEVMPAVNQIELHPYFAQPDVQAADAAHGIVTQAWSPIGGITFHPGYGEARKNVMQDPTIGTIAAEHGKTPAQVMLRWHLQQGRSAIPNRPTRDASRRTSTCSTSSSQPMSWRKSTASTRACVMGRTLTHHVQSFLICPSPRNRQISI
jgi:diketogulonate reductase-like aldo/keto reductase